MVPRSANVGGALSAALNARPEHSSDVVEHTGHDGMTPRDRAILALARSMLTGVTPTFEQAVAAVRRAVEQSIPAGRIFLLASGERGPVIGSLVSGVAITEDRKGIAIVRFRHDRSLETLGRFV